MFGMENQERQLLSRRCTDKRETITDSGSGRSLLQGMESKIHWFLDAMRPERFGKEGDDIYKLQGACAHMRWTTMTTFGLPEIRLPDPQLR
jgi:hypothetical protein